MDPTCNISVMGCAVTDIKLKYKQETRVAMESNKLVVLWNARLRL
jgi:hypothetical protein